MQRFSLARHVTVLAWAALVLDVVAVLVFPSAFMSVVPGFHSLVVAPRAVPWFLGALLPIAAVHALLAVAVWQRLRHGREPSSRVPT